VKKKHALAFGVALVIIIVISVAAFWQATYSEIHIVQSQESKNFECTVHELPLIEEDEVSNEDSRATPNANACFFFTTSASP